MSDFKEKYLKYKQKYLELKSQIGGAFPFAFGDGGSIAIMAKITGDTLDRVNERRLKLGLPREDNLHITLLQFFINFNNPRSDIFFNHTFIDTISRAFTTHLKRTGVELDSPRGSWDFLGIRPSLEDKYWARVYNIDPRFEQNVRNFRTDIYNFLNQNVGVDAAHPKFENRGKPHDNTDFVIYSTGPRREDELYAIVKNFYYGVNTWKPHISVVKMNELTSSSSANRQLFDRINGLSTTQQKSDAITAHIGQVNPISRIRMINNVNELYISIRTPVGMARLSGKQTEFHVRV